MKSGHTLHVCGPRCRPRRHRRRRRRLRRRRRRRRRRLVAHHTEPAANPAAEPATEPPTGLTLAYPNLSSAPAGQLDARASNISMYSAIQQNFDV
jgi:hypothetical protein